MISAAILLEPKRIFVKATPGYEIPSIGFAIPIDMAKTIKDQLDHPNTNSN